MQFDETSYKITSDKPIGRIAMLIGVIGLVLSLVGYFVDAGQFFFSYLVAFAFWTTIGLGGLFFTMLHHLTNATWSIVLRRIAENIMAVLPYMVIFALPLIFGIPHLYHWSHHDVVAADKLLQGKAAYLNVTFFIIRLIFYFVIWYLLTRFLYKLSISQDQKHEEDQIPRLRRISAPGMILFAVTITFASFDWLMSLDAHWYSTIYGVYVFSGSVLAVLAFLILTVIYFHSNNALVKQITLEHYHDLGKLLFAFVIFWGYMAFSQYLLIWYGNMPEETQWFLARWHGSWYIVALLIVFGHFVVPFFILFPFASKRNKTVMAIMAIWILLMHWVDLYWLAMPSLHTEGFTLSWINFVTMAGIGGVFVWIFQRKLHSQPLIPVNDPRLEQSINFVNH